MRSVDEVVAGIRAGQPVVLPTDTVYGLCATPYSEPPVRRLYRLKGRGEEQPTALVGRDLDFLLECVPELRGRAATIARALLPGPFTLVLPNPARRFRWISGTRPETIGVRVPDVEGAAREVLEQVGVVAATSANRPGEPDPRRLEDVAEELRAGAAALLDGGELPGTPSTVLDLTGRDPVVLREGAVSADEALARTRAALE
ncbi:MAG: threonylcarbamoyl-AMP synthase [Thermoleophilia bacterium]|nr:threonylcarbamoyl-AMP synthase [Thermoleophilia bacterium]